MRTRLVLALVPAALTLAAPAGAAITPVRLKIVGRAAPDRPFTDAPTEARLGDRPELALVLVGREGRGRRVVVADAEVAPLVLAGRAVPARDRRPWDAVPEATVRWFAVEPEAWRREGEVAPNGATSRYHTNVSVEPGTFGTWLGYDRIDYRETALGPPSSAPAARRRPATARPTRPDEDLHDGLGTMRYKATLCLGGPSVGAAAPPRCLGTPGAESVDATGIRGDVHRVSIRRDDSYVGYLTAFFLVPEVFGSAGRGARHQTERYVGADCADVLVGALRAMGYTGVGYTSVAALDRLARPVAGPGLLDAEGRADRPIAGIEVGDVVRIDYGGALAGATPRAFDHVAVVVEDRSDPRGPRRGGPDGQLDGHDVVVHMGHPRLVVEPLARQSPARVDVLRWDPRRLGKRRSR